ncbi:WW domain-binding protein 2 isoform X1 [Polistes fuscatus]|uniref:WW domain-binding protein 2 isoform X1 n=1 Tax=Polistes fuscatus TaxID=30207 RepID=UPI001CA86CB8|nr:WW domain-binding protein 2 isoform X1 [Polistes fuscatus]
MSLNTAHANGGVLIHAGELILLYCDNVSMEFHGQEHSAFVGTKRGRLYLTTHRMIFNAKNTNDEMKSFSFPFITLSEVELEQPMFSANCIRGKCRAQPNGNWIGECKFKLYFKSGGAIEFGQTMLRAAELAQRNGPDHDAPPPYTPPTTGWYAAPPVAYLAPGTRNYGWMPPGNVFPDAPPANSVFMTEMPPPYPGINSPYQGYASGTPQHPQGAWGGVNQQSNWVPTQPNGAPGLANPNYPLGGVYPNFNEYQQCPPYTQSPPYTQNPPYTQSPPYYTQSPPYTQAPQYPHNPQYTQNPLYTQCPPYTPYPGGNNYYSK